MNKLLTLLACLLINLFSYAQEVNTAPIDVDSLITDSLNMKNDPVYLIVEEPPRFNKGDINGFREFVTEKLRYPDKALRHNIQGSVFIQFIINEQGKLINAKVVKSVHESLDNEALRAVNSSPIWEPGKQGGKPVKVLITIPVNFRMFTQKENKP